MESKQRRDIMAVERQLLKALISCVELVNQHDRTYLELKIKELKQTDGESWAIGETIQRILHFYGNLNEEDLIQVNELLKEYYQSG